MSNSLLYILLLTAQIITTCYSKPYINKRVEKLLNKGDNNVNNNSHRMVLTPGGGSWSVTSVICGDEQCHKICYREFCYYDCLCVEHEGYGIVTMSSRCAMKEKRVCNKMCIGPICKPICKLHLYKECKNLSG